MHYTVDEQKVGALRIQRSSLFQNLKNTPVEISIVTHDGKDRAQVQAFIANIYAAAYQAKIVVQYPLLMSLKDSSGEILAAIGFRFASSGPLFLEQYLPGPVDKLLDVRRSAVVEVGNLASRGGSVSLILFAALAAYLHFLGLEYTVVTSTALLERKFRQLGFNPERIVEAEPTSPSQQKEQWGSYYLSRPHVLKGSIDAGYARLQAYLGAEFMHCPAVPSLSQSLLEESRNAV